MNSNDFIIKIIPLGGLGEIGLNMMVFERSDELVVVDCGLMFPGDSLPGVDYVIPDFTYLLDKLDRIQGVILTHGHEDHIGALPFLLRQAPLPVYGTPLTLGLVREKLSEYGLDSRIPLHKTTAGQVLRLGGFEVEFIRVSHSIADSLALAFRTELGALVHTGDFKVDPTPVDGQRLDLAAFARWGDEGVLALLSDSTNVEWSGFTLSEREVGRALREVFEDAPGRIIIAMFASNIHRIQLVFEAAEHFGRKVALLGRSMEANIRIARELGYLTVPPGIIVEVNALKKISPEKIVLLSTGTQGEPLSGLARLARDEHKQISIVPGDTVVLSSRFIPGNERAIDFLINEFYRRGAEVIYEKVSDIHVSGHGSQEELKLMIALTRPHYFIPIHGEYRHLAKHAQLARRMGIPAERVLLAEDGDVITFNEVGGERIGRIEAGRQVVHGACIADSEDVVLSERRKLGREGILVVLVKVRENGAGLVAPLELTSSGVFYQEESAARMEEISLFAEEELRPRLEKLVQEGKGRQVLEEEVRLSLKRYLKKNLIRFPVVLPVIVEV